MYLQVKIRQVTFNRFYLPFCTYLQTYNRIPESREFRANFTAHVHRGKNTPIFPAPYATEACVGAWIVRPGASNAAAHPVYYTNSRDSIFGINTQYNRPEAQMKRSYLELRPRDCRNSSVQGVNIFKSQNLRVAESICRIRVKINAKSRGLSLLLVLLPLFQFPISQGVLLPLGV